MQTMILKLKRLGAKANMLEQVKRDLDLTQVTEVLKLANQLERVTLLKAFL